MFLPVSNHQQKSLVAKVQRREMPDMGMLFLNIKVRRSNLISDSLNEVSDHWFRTARAILIELGILQEKKQDY